MKFLVVASDLTQESGYSTYAKNIIQPLRAKGHQVIVAVHRRSPELRVSQFEVFERESLFYLWNPIRIYEAAKKLRKIIEEEKPDVVHMVVEHHQQLLAFMRINSHVTVVVTVHGTYIYLPEHLHGWRKSIALKLYKLAHTKVSKVIAVSEFTKKRYLAKSKIHKKNVSVVHNATNMTCATMDRSANKSDKPYHAITIGEVKSRKGIKESIELLSEWSRYNLVYVVYDVVGNLTTGSAYVAQVKLLSEKLSHEFFTVRFHGRVTNEVRDKLLRSSSVYMHLEPVVKEGINVEGFGIGIIDAAACGVPALVSRGTATEEAVLHGKTGFCVDVANVKKCEEAVTKILLHAVIRHEDMIAWADQHSPEKKVEEYLKCVTD